jgi:hypothetical protein
MFKINRATTKSADGSTLVVPISQEEFDAVALIHHYLPICKEVDPQELYVDLGAMFMAPYGYCFYAFYLFDKYLRRKEGLTDPTGTIIGTIVIRDDWDLGLLIAYRSGMPHRVSKKLHAWRKVHAPMLTMVTPGESHSENQPQLLTYEETEQDLEPWYVGANPQALFEEFYMRVTWPETVLFLYPENWLVPNQTQQFLSLVTKEPAIKSAFVITKDPVVVSDCFHDELIVLGRQQ